MEEVNNSNRKILVLIAVLGLIIGSIVCVFAFNLGKNAISGNEEENQTKPEEKEDDHESATPLLYEVTKEGSDTKIYLFGSIHVANTQSLVFPKYLINAYDNSKYVACEIDMVKAETDPEAIALQQQMLIYNDGTKLKDHMDPKVYDKLIKFLKDKGMYAEQYEMVSPYYFTSLITIRAATDANVSAMTGIDKYFINRAKNDKKEILEVESFEFQFKLLLSFPERLYEMMIEAMVDNYEATVEGTKQLYETWKRGDPQEITNLVAKDNSITEEDRKKYSEAEIAMFEDYNNKLIYDRNVTMTEKVETYFNEGKSTFFMVGEAHIVGQKGIANLLVQKGYTVKQVTK